MNKDVCGLQFLYNGEAATKIPATHNCVIRKAQNTVLIILSDIEELSLTKQETLSSHGSISN